MVTALAGEINAWGTAVCCESRPGSWALTLTAVAGVGVMICRVCHPNKVLGFSSNSSVLNTTLTSPSSAVRDHEGSLRPLYKTLVACKETPGYRRVFFVSLLVNVGALIRIMMGRNYATITIVAMGMIFCNRSRALAHSRCLLQFGACCCTVSQTAGRGNDPRSTQKK